MAAETRLNTAAAYLCTAAETLRAAGLAAFADEIELFIATLDAELLLGDAGED